HDASSLVETGLASSPSGVGEIHLRRETRQAASLRFRSLVAANRLRVPVKQKEQRIAEKRAPRQQTGDQRIFLVAAQRGIVELQHPASGAFDQRRPGGNV